MTFDSEHTEGFTQESMKYRKEISRLRKALHTIANSECINPEEYALEVLLKFYSGIGDRRHHMTMDELFDTWFEKQFPRNQDDPSFKSGVKEAWDVALEIGERADYERWEDLVRNILGVES